MDINASKTEAIQLPFYLLKNKNHGITKYSRLRKILRILARRVRGKRKTPVFVLLKRDERFLVNGDCSKVNVDNGMFSIYSDGLILNSYEHYRVYEFAKNHINGIELFWSFAKKHLAEGLGDEKLPIHSCELPWNNKNSDLYKILLKILRESPLN